MAFYEPGGVRGRVVEEKRTVEVRDASTLPFNDPMDEDTAHTLETHPEGLEGLMPIFRRKRTVTNCAGEGKPSRGESFVINLPKEVIIPTDRMCRPTAYLSALRGDIVMRSTTRRAEFTPLRLKG